MTYQKLNKKYYELLNIAENANGRKETVSLLHKAEKIRNKIAKATTTLKCVNCYGMGYRKISINETKTCLTCFGKGYVKKKIELQITKKIKIKP